MNSFIRSKFFATAISAVVTLTAIDLIGAGIGYFFNSAWALSFVIAVLQIGIGASILRIMPSRIDLIKGLIANAVAYVVLDRVASFLFRGYYKPSLVILVSVMVAASCISQYLVIKAIELAIANKKQISFKAGN